MPELKKEMTTDWMIDELGELPEGSTQMLLACVCGSRFTVELPPELVRLSTTKRIKARCKCGRQYAEVLDLQEASA
jgi:hypothetical protein